VAAAGQQQPGLARRDHRGAEIDARHRAAGRLADAALKPDDAETRYLLGLAAISINRRDDALQQFKILKTLDSSLAEKLYAALYSDKVIRVSRAANSP